MYCTSGKHYWLDQYAAQLCCHPNYTQVRDVSRQNLEGALAVHSIMEGKMWSGWQVAEGRSPFSRLFYDNLYVYTKEPGKRIEENYLLQTFLSFDEKGDPFIAAVVSGMEVYGHDRPVKIYVYSKPLTKLLKQAKSEEEEKNILCDWASLF